MVFETLQVDQLCADAENTRGVESTASNPQEFVHITFTNLAVATPILMSCCTDGHSCVRAPVYP